MTVRDFGLRRQQMVLQNWPHWFLLLNHHQAPILLPQPMNMHRKAWRYSAIYCNMSYFGMFCVLQASRKTYKKHQKTIINNILKHVTGYVGTSWNVLNHPPPSNVSQKYIRMTFNEMGHDSQSFHCRHQVVLVRKMLLVPLLACLFASLGTEIAAWSQPSIVSQPPKKWLGGRGEAKWGSLVGRMWGVSHPDRFYMGYSILYLLYPYLGWDVNLTTW